VNRKPSPILTREKSTSVSYFPTFLCPPISSGLGTMQLCLACGPHMTLPLLWVFFSNKVLGEVYGKPIEQYFNFILFIIGTNAIFVFISLIGLIISKPYFHFHFQAFCSIRAKRLRLDIFRHTIPDIPWQAITNCCMLLHKRWPSLTLSPSHVWLAGRICATS
jgi:hypothetical protein